MRYLFLLLTFAFTTELEVDGNLKVTGTVDVNNNPITNVGAPLAMTDAVNAGILQDALRDDGQYEYSFIMVYVNNGGSTDNGASHFKKFNATEDIIHNHTMNDLYSYVSTLLNDGWRLESISGNNITWWIFKRLIEEND